MICCLLLPVRMTGRRRERLKIVRPTRRHEPVRVPLDDVFLFFCFCSSSRCFLESPSALPRLLPVTLGLRQLLDSLSNLASESCRRTVATWDGMLDIGADQSNYRERLLVKRLTVVSSNPSAAHDRCAVNANTRVDAAITVPDGPVSTSADSLARR